MSNINDGAHDEVKKVEEPGDLIKGTWIGARLYYNYDHNMLMSLFLQYFNQNLIISMGLLVIYDILSNEYKLEPAELATSTAIIAIPWAPKIFYGIIIDTFPICGSTKKSYLIILGTLFSICAFGAAVIDYETHIPIVAFVTTTQVCSAMMDVVVDGLSVAQSRIDPKLGSQDLQALTTLTSGLAGMTGYLVGGILTQKGYAR